MQQRDCNATPTFWKIIINIFKHELGIYVHVYIDEIFIFSKAYKKHLAHVRTMLLRLNDHKFCTLRDHSQFHPAVLSVLGHTITENGISPQPQNVTKIQHCSYRQKSQALQSFLAMLNHLHQFPPNLTTVSSLSTDLAASTATYDWTLLYSKSFQQVQNTLAADVGLRPLDYTSTEAIHLVTDASLIGTGAWFGQGPNRNQI